MRKKHYIFLMILLVLEIRVGGLEYPFKDQTTYIIVSCDPNTVLIPTVYTKGSWPMISSDKSIFHQTCQQCSQQSSSFVSTLLTTKYKFVKVLKETLLKRFHSNVHINIENRQIHAVVGSMKWLSDSLVILMIHKRSSKFHTHQTWGKSILVVCAHDWFFSEIF